MTTAETRIAFLALLIAALVLAFDLALPLGIAGGVLYLAVVLLGIWLPRRWHVVALAVLASLLMVLGYFFSEKESGSVEWAILANRALAFLVIWTSAFFLILHKGTERALRRSEEQFRNLADRSLEGILIGDENGKPLYANQAMADLFGYASPDVILRLDNYDVLFAAEEREHLHKYRDRRFRGERVPNEYEVRGLREDGQEIWIHSSVRQVDWHGREAEQGTHADITERKPTEDVRSGNEANFRDVIETSQHGFLVHENSVLRYANDALARIFKYDSPSELHALPSAMELWAPAERIRMSELYKARMRGEAVPTEYEVEGVGKDGSRIWLRNSARFIDWEGRRLVSAAVTDITEFKRLQDELETYVQLFDRWKKTNFIGIIQSNAYGGIIDANDTMLEMLGYSRQELLEGSLDWTELTPPEFLYLDEQAIKEAASRGLFTPFEKEYIHKDGHRVPIMVGGAQYKETPAEGISFVVDLTERKRLEQQVGRAQKMDAIGQLTGGIAHDFNNILGIIMGNLELLQHHAKDNPEIMHYAERALEGSQRGADITRKLLGFSRHEPGTVGRISVNDPIGEMQNLVARSLTATIKVETHLADDVWPVEIDPGDFRDALLNLSLNARDAMPDGGSLIIETANKVLDERYVMLNPSATAGEFVMISVSDTGAGMTAEVRDKLFDPFFTTKEFGRGTGLGLSMVYGFVERSGGHIKVYSEPGRGATFRIYLPRASGEWAAEEASDHTFDLPRGSETILIVDDEEKLLDVAVEYLEDLGYRTLTASDGKQALEVLRERTDIDLLFCDVIMPGGLDGYRLALETHKLRPSLKVLLTSGFTKKREEYANGDGGYIAGLASNLLSKPYNAHELAFAVRRALNDGLVKATNPSIIVVDDDRQIAELVCKTAQSIDFDVRVASSAEEFKALYGDGEPSVIVMDIGMPDVDGIELLDWLADKQCVSPIVLMGGHGPHYLNSASHIASAKGGRIVGTLTKPFKLEELEMLLQRSLGVHAV